MQEFRHLLPANPIAYCALIGVICCSANAVSAAEESIECPAGYEDHLPMHELTCMSDEELRTLRGGFMLDNQIVIGFGFERIVRVDGEIQEHVIAGLPTLNLANNIQLVPISRSIDSGNQHLVLQGIGFEDLASQRGISMDGSSSGLTPQIQLVPSTAALQEMMSNVIQNSLDDTSIEQLRVINIDLMGLGEAPLFDPQRDLNPAMFENLGL